MSPDCFQPGLIHINRLHCMAKGGPYSVTAFFSSEPAEMRTP
jgi:hypothetical protein